MKITFVLPGYSWKPVGGFRVVYEYANQLVDRGHEVTVVHPRFLKNIDLSPLNFYYWLRSKVGRLRNIFITPNVKWQPMNGRVRMLYVPEPIAQYIPDSGVIFATAWQTSEYIAEYPINKGEKFYLVQDFGHWFGPQERLEASWKFPLKKVTISHWLYEKVISVTETMEGTINIPNGIDLNRFRKMTEINNRPKRVAMMYSTSKYKGVEDGIQAVKVCKAKYPDLQSTVFGTGFRPHQLPSWIEYKHNISELELVNIYNHSTIFICSSLAEGFALPPAEAMACGCAVASTDCGGNREYAENGVTALLSPPNAPEMLARNVIRLLEDDDLRIKLARAGYERIQQFTWEHSTNLLEQFITETIKQ